RTVRQHERAEGVSGGAQRLFGAIDGDRDALERLIIETAFAVRHALAGEDTTDHGRAEHRRDAAGVELDKLHAARMAIAVRIHLLTKFVLQAGGIQGHAQARPARNWLEIKECDLPAIAGKFDAAKQVALSEASE